MRRWMIAAALAAATAAVAASAQQPPEGAPPPAGMHAPTTRAEVQAGVREQFARVDANGDGFISRAEFDAARAAMQADRAPPPPGAAAGAPPPPPGGGLGMGMGMGGHWFDRVDADHDGRVSLAEAESAAMTAFDMIDADHDGTISPEERHAAREMMRMMHPGRGE